MADKWYYARGGARQGPYTPLQFHTLVIDGTLLTTDTVWKNDIARGVSADKVKNLFPAPRPAVASPSVTAPPVLLPVQPPADKPPAPAHVEPAPRVKKAMAVSGATVVSQDGKYVRFRKTCTTCRHEEASWGTMAILPGTMRTTFFCPKCRKSREVLLRGMQN